MPRSTFLPEDPDPDFDAALEVADDDRHAATHRRRTRQRDLSVRVVSEGRSGRTAVDADGTDEEESGAPANLSSYDVAAHGPEPVPDWLVTELSARDTPLGVLKSGKEADVSLLDRSVPGGPGCLLAVKTFRDAGTACSIATPATRKDARSAVRGRPAPWPIERGSVAS